MSPEGSCPCAKWLSYVCPSARWPHYVSRRALKRRGFLRSSQPSGRVDLHLCVPHMSVAFRGSLFPCDNMLFVLDAHQGNSVANVMMLTQPQRQKSGETKSRS